MNPSPSQNGFTSGDFKMEIDAALATLSSIQPRDGLEQRVLARIAAAPPLPWYHRFSLAPAGSQRWMLAAASAVVVAGGVGMSIYRSHLSTTPVAAPVALHAPHPAQQAVAAAAAVAVTNHPLQSNPARTRHRGIRRSYRAVHERVPLPHGAAVPLRPHTQPSMQ